MSLYDRVVAEADDPMQKHRDAYDALLKKKTAKAKKPKPLLRLRGKVLYDGKTPVLKIYGGRYRHRGVVTPGSGFGVEDVATGESLTKTPDKILKYPKRDPLQATHSPFGRFKEAVEWAREYWRRKKAK